MENVLIASLGESPIVVTAMYDLLTQQKELEINKVVVLQPDGGLIPLAFDLIQEVLKDRCEVIAERLPVEDADDEADSFTFLRTLYRLLNDAQESGQTIYLSLAGGRKNMSALMALLVPLFPCVKGLYHVIDKDEASPHRYHFKSIEEILDLSDDDRLSYFSFDSDQLGRLKLVEIPYGEQQQVSDGLRSLLFTITEEELDDLWDKDPQQAEMVETYRRITQKPTSAPVLQIRLTERVKDEYERMRRQNQFRARRFMACFEQMNNPYRLKDKIHGSGFNRGSLSFHFYKRNDTAERPFYHTEPQGIHFFPKAKVETVIISGLAIERDNGSYEPTGDELLQEFDPTEATVPLEAILPAGASAESTSMEESALIVPLGNTPMLATQLYTLLTYQGSNIRKVILVYPANSQEIKNGADLLEKAFEDEGKSVSCLPAVVQGYADIDSREACLAYERTLEEAIEAVCKDYQVELALSGGRKGMAALAMFVAQRKSIRYVYHTLITDKLLRDKVEKETTIDELRPTKVSKQVRNNRLFLREYEGSGPYTKFVPFKVPVLPARG